MKFQVMHSSSLRRIFAKVAHLMFGIEKPLNNLNLKLSKIVWALAFERFVRSLSEKDWKGGEKIIIPSFFKSGEKMSFWTTSTREVLAFERAESDIILEFGTNNGGSLKALSALLGNNFRFFGFDTFEGLPEPWDRVKKGAIRGIGFPSILWEGYESNIDRDKLLLEEEKYLNVPGGSNIEIHKGLFAETLPNLISPDFKHRIALIHFDADIYHGTRPVLDILLTDLNHSVVVMFDEFNSVLHEFRAFMEFTSNTKHLDWKLVCASEDFCQVCFFVSPRNLVSTRKS